MISKRLKSLVKYINKDDKLIDIGCDHALIDIYLIRNNLLNYVIVSDINKNALQQGISNINKYKVNNIETRLGNGLEVLNKDDIIDTILISGMGSHTITSILKNDYIDNINKIIIQSNNDYEFLRKDIIKLGFYIDIEEAVIDNNKLYLNIIFKRGFRKYSKYELKFGLLSMINKDIYYNYLINKYNNLILLNGKDIYKEYINYLNNNK